MDLYDGGIEAEGTMVGLAVDGHAAAFPDDCHRKRETCYEQATRLARVVLKADRDHKRAIMLARCRVRRMGRAVEEGPRQLKDNCGSCGHHTRRGLMSQIEEGASPDVAGACLGAVTAALARANVVSPHIVGQAWWS